MNYTNLTNFTFAERTKPDTLVHFVALNVIFFLTLVGNLAVVFVIIDTKKRKSFWASFSNKNRISFYILCLSIADINVAFLSILPQIIELNNIYWLSDSNLACKLVRFIQVFSVYASTYTKIQMGMDRFNCICRPLKSLTWTIDNAFKAILLSYLLSALLTVPQLFIWTVVEHPLAPNKKSCRASFGLNYTQEIEQIYVLYHAAAQFFVPLIILTVLYTAIAIKINKLVSSKRESARPLSMPSESESNTVKYLRPVSVHSNKSQEISSALQKSTLKSEKSPMLKRSNLNVALNEDKISSLATSETDFRVRQHITKKSLYCLKQTKIRTFKSTLTIVIAFILCTLPFYTIQVLLTIIRKPEKISDELMNKFMRKLHYFSLI